MTYNVFIGTLYPTQSINQAVLLSGGVLGFHLTRCHVGRGLPPY